jgi:hypothetical protein
VCSVNTVACGRLHPFLLFRIHHVFKTRTSFGALWIWTGANEGPTNGYKKLLGADNTHEAKACIINMKERGNSNLNLRIN